MILNDRNRRLAFLFGRQSGIRAGSGALDQVSEHSAPNARGSASWKSRTRSCAGILELALIRRDLRDTFVAAPSPSARLH
jgi:hypothetical protein